jgi:hypothetical protein
MTGSGVSVRSGAAFIAVLALVAAAFLLGASPASAVDCDSVCENAKARQPRVRMGRERRR